MQPIEMLDSQMLGRSNRLSSLSINLDEMQTSPPQWSPGNSSLGQISPNSRSQDSNSIHRGGVVTMTCFDTLPFMHLVE